MEVSKKMTKDGIEVEVAMYLRVLGYPTVGKQWAAHCLETDLVGFGKTFDQALAELKELTFMQVSFAIQMDDPSLLNCPAPPSIIEAWVIASFQAVEDFMRPKKRKGKKEYLARTIPLEKPNHLGSCFVQT